MRGAFTVSVPALPVPTVLVEIDDPPATLSVRDAITASLPPAPPVTPGDAPATVSGESKFVPLTAVEELPINWPPRLRDQLLSVTGVG